MPIRWLCGVTLSSDNVGVKINGSYLVAWSAQYLVKQSEQSKALDMLQSLQDDIKWPTQPCLSRLQGI